MLNDRNVVVAVPDHGDGEPITVRLSHKPTGATAEAKAATYAEARELALEALGREVEVREAAQALRSSPVALPLGQPQGRPPIEKITMSDLEQMSRER